MNIDFSLLQDYKLPQEEWVNWSFDHPQYQGIPLTFFDKFNRTRLKCCDLSQVSTQRQDDQFVQIVGNTKVTNKDYISKNIKMTDRRKNTQSSTRTFTKKQKKALRTWHTQYKTKMRELTVKNDWINVKSINKRDLTENIPKVGKLSIQQLQRKGKLHHLNQKVQKISWNPLGFKQNQEYKVKSIKTAEDDFLLNKASQLIDDSERRNSIVCSIQFLLAILTVRGGQYPWNIEIQKSQNLLVFQNYRSEDDKDGQTYLDLFTTNENTSNNMPTEQSKIKQQCINATKYTKIFKDLLASGQVFQQEQSNQQQEQNNDQQQKQQEEEQEEDQQAQELDHLKKYVKISLDDVDIYTAVNIDGVKTKSDGSVQQCLIRAFMQTGTDGAWIQDIKKTQGTLVFQQYLSNSCSVQKWICQGRIAGVQMIKFGFIGFEKSKPKIINVAQTTCKNLQKNISFQQTQCWPILKYFTNILFACENGKYVLSRSPYTPICLKLYKLPEESEEQEEDAEQAS